MTLRTNILTLLMLMCISSVNAQNTYKNPVYGQDFPDPSVQRAADGYFYSYATGPRCLRSKDLVNWERVSGVFGRPTWNDTTYVDASGTKKTDYYGFWACDVSRNDDNYIMYYASALWGEHARTGIGVATGNSLSCFTDHGKLFRGSEIGVSNSIDPVYVEEKDKKYLAWGSFYGIYMTELSDDGLQVKDAKRKNLLAGGAFEAAMFHKRGEYYYLFCSIGSCCEGLNSTYTTVVGRSTKLTGPYVDRQGGLMTNNNYTVVIQGDANWKGPGHNSEIVTDDNGDDWLLYHCYSVKDPDAGRVMLLDKIEWTEDGWPVVNNGSPSTEAKAAPVFYSGDGSNKTYKFRNMDMARSDFKFWTVESSADCTLKSGAGTVFSPFGQAKSGGTFDIYQTASGMPDGLYELKANTFDSKYSVALYVNGLETLVHDESQLPTVPTDNNTSSQFLKGNYQRSVYGVVTDGVLRIGMRSVRPLEQRERFSIGNMQVIYREKNPQVMNTVINGYNALADSLLNTDVACYAEYQTALQACIAAMDANSDLDTRYDYIVNLSKAVDSVKTSVKLYGMLNSKIAWLEEQIEISEREEYSNQAVKDLLIKAKNVMAQASLNNSKLEELLNRMQESVDNMKSLFEKGDGTASNPYIITRPEQMNNMRCVLVSEQTVHFAMERDIDLSGYEWEQLNTSKDKYRHWINFDGRGHVIYNLKPANDNGYPSFFGTLCGECRNVGFVDACIRGTSTGAGVLSGYIGHSSFKDADGNPLPVTVENCYFTGTIEADGYIGVVGGTINNCPVTIKNVYSNVDILGTGFSGGLVGRVRTELTIENCYTAGNIQAPIAAPIAAGGQSMSTPSSIYNNVIAWNKEINGVNDNSVVVPFAVTASSDVLTNTFVFEGMKLNGESVSDGKTHAELQSIAKTWGSPWHSDPAAGNGYPILQWQYSRGDYHEICGFPITDGIDGVTPDVPQRSDGLIYDLSGRMVSKPLRGIYIVNGKKVLY